MKFRLPRKIKKKLKKGVFIDKRNHPFYPIAFPCKIEEDYIDYKKGYLTKL